MQDITGAFKHIFSANATRLAIIDHVCKKQYDYGQLEDLSSKLAGQLVGYAGNNSKIMLLYANQMEMVISYFACLQLGATAVPVNPEFHPDEIAGFITHAEPDIILTSREFMAQISPSVKTKILCFGPSEGDQVSLASLQNSARLKQEIFPYISKDLLMCIMFTSGSTGVPKAIPLRFRQVAGQAKLMAETHARDESCRFYMVLPLAYIGGLYNMLAYFFAGGSVVVDKVFSAGGIYRFWDTVLAHDANSLWLTPSMIAALMAIGPEDEEQAKRISKQIRWAIGAMGPIPGITKRQFEDMFGFRLQKAYGITETLLCCSWKDRFDIPVESVGSPMPGSEVVIISDAGEVLSAGEEGEIRVRGEYVLEEYYHQPDQTEAAFDGNGYFKTGDLGCIDKDGNVFITGRIKDVIKRGGLNISPAEIENIILRMEKVKEVAVIGIPDEMYGEKIAAVVTPTVANGVTMEGITEHCVKYLSAIKIPTIIHVMPQLPLNPSGKPDKRAIKAMLANVKESSK